MLRDVRCCAVAHVLLCEWNASRCNGRCFKSVWVNRLKVHFLLVLDRTGHLVMSGERLHFWTPDKTITQTTEKRTFVPTPQEPLCGDFIEFINLLYLY